MEATSYKDGKCSVTVNSGANIYVEENGDTTYEEITDAKLAIAGQEPIYLNIRYVETDDTYSYEFNSKNLDKLDYLYNKLKEDPVKFREEYGNLESVILNFKAQIQEIIQGEIDNGRINEIFDEVGLKVDGAVAAKLEDGDINNIVANGDKNTGALDVYVEDDGVGETHLNEAAKENEEADLEASEEAKAQDDVEL